MIQVALKPGDQLRDSLSPSGKGIAAGMERQNKMEKMGVGGRLKDNSKLLRQISIYRTKEVWRGEGAACCWRKRREILCLPSEVPSAVLTLGNSVNR